MTWYESWTARHHSRDPPLCAAKDRSSAQRSLGLTPVSAFERNFILIDQETSTGSSAPPPLAHVRQCARILFRSIPWMTWMSTLNFLPGRHRGLPTSRHPRRSHCRGISGRASFEVNRITWTIRLFGCDHKRAAERVHQEKRCLLDHEMDTHFHGQAVLRSGRQRACTCISGLVDEDGTNVFAPRTRWHAKPITLRWGNWRACCKTLPEYMPSYVRT